MAMLPGPWIDYSNTGVPVPLNTFVSVRFRVGQEILAEPASNFVWTWYTNNPRWALYDVVAYRVWSEVEEPTEPSQGA